MSAIMTFLRRHKKASNPKHPFHWDRVFVGNDEMKAFGDELIEFCEGYAANMAELEKLREQIRGMSL